MRTVLGLSPRSANLGRDCRVFASRVARVTAASACASTAPLHTRGRRVEVGACWTVAESAEGAPVDTARCGCRGGSTCGVVGVGKRGPGGWVEWGVWCGSGEVANGQAMWPPSPHLLCLLFLLFLLSLPSLFCRPPPSATLRCIRIKLSFPAANFCRSVLSVPAGNQRLVCCGSAHFQPCTTAHIPLDLDLPRSHFRTRLCCSRHFLSISISISLLSTLSTLSTLSSLSLSLLSLLSLLSPLPTRLTTK